MIYLSTYKGQVPRAKIVMRNTASCEYSKAERDQSTNSKSGFFILQNNLNSPLCLSYPFFFFPIMNPCNYPLLFSLFAPIFHPCIIFAGRPKSACDGPRIFAVFHTGGISSQPA